MKITFWVTTALLAFFMGMSGANMLLGTEMGRAGLAALGYPAYFGTILGAAKLLGVIALLLPFIPARVKGFAYAGFTINLVAAVLSHLFMKDYGHVIGPVPGLILLAVSYWSWLKVAKKA